MVVFGEGLWWWDLVSDFLLVAFVFNLGSYFLVDFGGGCLWSIFGEENWR